MTPLGFDPLEHLKQVRRFNRSNRFTTEIRKHPFMNLLPIPRPRRLRERCLLCHQPFSHSSATAKKVLVLASDSARRFAQGQCRPPTHAERHPASRARLKETSGYAPRVSSFSYPIDAVFEPPEPPACGGDEHEQPALVVQPVGLFSSFGRPNPQFRECWHDRGYRVGRFRGTPAIYPHPC